MNETLKKTGFTLVELMVTIAISAMLVLTVGVVMLDTQRGWLDTYAKVHGGAADDAAMAKVAFDRIVRKSSRSMYLLPTTDDLTVYYYSDWQNSPSVDCSARLYRSSVNPSEMYIEHTRLDNGDSISAVRLASNVSDLEFLPVSGGLTMKLTLDDGREQTTVVSTAILHNE